MERVERHHQFATKELRFSEGSQSRISGYAATFDTEAQLPGFTEVIRPGAFDRALREKQDVVALFNHDENFVLGRTTSGTLRLRQDSKGLWFDCDLPGTQAARDLHESIKRKDVAGCSFAFTLPHDGAQTWTTRGNDVLRELTDLNLHDISAVTYPAYSNTSVDARTTAQAAEVRSRAFTNKVDSLKGWRIVQESETEWRVYDADGKRFSSVVVPTRASRRLYINDLILEL